MKLTYIIGRHAQNDDPKKVERGAAKPQRGSVPRWVEALDEESRANDGADA